MTQSSPLLVRLNGDTQATECEGPVVYPVGTEVVVENVEGRRFALFSTSPDATTLDGLDSSAFLRSTGKAADADLLDGQDGAYYANPGFFAGGLYRPDGGVGTTHLGDTAEALNGNINSGFYEVVNNPAAPDGNWWLIQHLRHTNTGNDYSRQVAYQMTGAGDRVFTRRKEGNLANRTWSAWKLLYEDTGWIELTGFVNGASAYQTGLGNSWTPRYRRKGGVVYLEGLVNSGTTATVHVCTLPAGFRPGTGVKMVNMFAAGPSTRRMDIGANGAMTFRELVGTGSTAWHNISTSFAQEN